ncbi:MAG: phage head closure protein [Syntrophales bacterium]|jgi:SPP1 family predicted phage head-tail adaptor|nr:phage head closure protein [Syntrophales bacterium]
MTRTGERDQFIVFQYKTRVSDGMGGFADTWNDLCSVWAKITTLRSDEAIIAMQSSASVIHNINIRYRGGITSAMRIKHGQKYYSIIGKPIDVKMQRKELDIKAKEG